MQSNLPNISFTFGGLSIQATNKTTQTKILKNLKKMQNANYIVRDAKTQKVANFYSTKLPRASHFAHECKREMKALSGREHEVLVKIEGEAEPLTEEQYNGLDSRTD